MSSRAWIMAAGVAAVTCAAAAWWFWPVNTALPDVYTTLPDAAAITPDYSGCVIPPNIAPLNFVIGPAADEYRVKIHAANGEPILLGGPCPRITIPPGPWRDLLSKNRGGQIVVDIYARSADGRWQRFGPITQRVAEEEIDPYLAYRLLGPLHSAYVRMGTYQRDLRTFRETPILTSRGRCVNCHSFVRNRPDPVIMHMRGDDGVAMLVARDGRVSKLNTRTRFNKSPAAYTAWHPSGKLAAFSVNSLVLLHHRSTRETRDVFDYASDLGLYVAGPKQVIAGRKIARPDRLETFPAWSPDGKYLYFASATPTWPADARQREILPEDYRNVRYDLMRVEYDIETGGWGDVETVLAGSDMDPPRSLTQPRISPDGRFVLFCAARYGNFPVYMSDSDLYMLDLSEPKRTWRLKANSSAAESWHGWSSNGRWIVFSSKRRNGVFAQPHFSYIDADGTSYKPFVLPQEDPAFYASFLKTYNVPELLTGPVTIPEDRWVEAIRSTADGHPVSTVTGATPPATSQPTSHPLPPADGPGTDYQ